MVHHCFHIPMLALRLGLDRPPFHVYIDLIRRPLARFNGDALHRALVIGTPRQVALNVPSVPGNDGDKLSIALDSTPGDRSCE